MAAEKNKFMTRRNRWKVGARIFNFRLDDKGGLWFLYPIHCTNYFSITIRKYVFSFFSKEPLCLTQLQKALELIRLLLSISSWFCKKKKSTIFSILLLRLTHTCHPFWWNMFSIVREKKSGKKTSEMRPIGSLVPCPYGQHGCLC